MRQKKSQSGFQSDKELVEIFMVATACFSVVGIFNIVFVPESMQKTVFSGAMYLQVFVYCVLLAFRSWRKKSFFWSIFSSLCALYLLWFSQYLFRGVDTDGIELIGVVLMIAVMIGVGLMVFAYKSIKEKRSLIDLTLGTQVVKGAVAIMWGVLIGGIGLFFIIGGMYSLFNYIIPGMLVQ